MNSRQVIRAIGALVVALFAAPLTVAIAQDADTAWSTGDLATAERLYTQRLAVDSVDQRALHRMALLRAWADELDASLTLFDRLLRVAPDNREARRDRAQVLAWRGDLDTARDAYRSLVSADPADVESRLGLARVHLWSDDPRSAEAIYESVLADNPRDPVALAGHARSASWSGRLAEGETRWRRALEIEPDRVEYLHGLAQTLRWQGRDAAALEVLRLAHALDPDDAALEHDLMLVQADLASFAGPTLRYENDSDGNRITTLTVAGAWRPVPRLAVTVDAYRVDADDATVDFDANAEGFLTGVEVVSEPGWRLDAAIGLDDGERETTTLYQIDVRSPDRERVGFQLSASRRALNATAVSIGRGVTLSEVRGAVHAVPGARWWIELGVGRADFDGRVSNRRLAGHVYAQRALGAGWTVGLLSRALSFERDANEGYFDPDFYGVTEIDIGLDREFDEWRLGFSVGPGVQHLGDSGETSATVRGGGRAVYRIAPGREVVLDAGFATAGVQSFTTGDADYRYYTVGITTRWAF